MYNHAFFLFYMGTYINVPLAGKELKLQIGHSVLSVHVYY